jgi:hypothetical protein
VTSTPAAFTFYEHATGQPIGVVIARLLMRLDADGRCT